jgi:hypothetical protein
VQNLREIYINQGIDVYEEASNPLLAAKGEAGLKGKVKYGYTYASLGSAANASVAHDVFGYPGTALIASDVSGNPTGLIKGFVPHYKVLGGFTVGLNEPAYPFTGYPAGAISSTAYSLTLTKPIINAVALTTDATVASAKTTGLDAGTYVEAVSYIDARGIEAFAYIGIKETLQTFYAYTAYKLYGDARITDSIDPLLTVPATNATTTYALVIEGSGGNYISANTVEPKAIGVTSYTSSTLNYTLDGVAGRSVAAVSGLLTDVNFVENKTTAIIGDHGVLFQAASVKLTTWTVAGAKYLFVPDEAIAVGTAIAPAITVAKNQNVILSDGTVAANVKFTTANTVVGGNGTMNLAPVQKTFYEYEIQADGTYALFKIGVMDALYAAATSASYASGTPSVNYAQSIAQLALNNGAYGYINNTAILGSTTTTKFTSVAIDTEPTAAPLAAKTLPKYTGEGTQNLVFPAADQGAYVLALTGYNAAGTVVANSLFIVHVNDGSLTGAWNKSGIDFDYAALVSNIETLPGGILRVYASVNGADVVVGDTAAVGEAQGTAQPDTFAIGDYIVFTATFAHKLVAADFDLDQYQSVPADGVKITGDATPASDGYYLKSNSDKFNKDIYASYPGLFFDGPKELVPAKAGSAGTVATVETANYFGSGAAIAALVTGATGAASVYHVYGSDPVASLTGYTKVDTLAEVNAAGKWTQVQSNLFGNAWFVVVYQN